MQNILIEAARRLAQGHRRPLPPGALPTGVVAGIPLPQAWAAGPDRSRSRRFRARTAQNPAARTLRGKQMTPPRRRLPGGSCSTTLVIAGALGAICGQVMVLDVSMIQPKTTVR